MTSADAPPVEYGRRGLPRVVMHLDMDAFYAAIEVREHPELAGKPLIIGHNGRRGVVSTCSYEAREYGVRSAMPSVTADRLCPHAVWLPGRMKLYVTESRKIRRLMEHVSPVVEPISIDEAFIDLTGIAKDLDDGARIGNALRARIREERRLTASAGVAPNKFLAKLASDMDKPDGMVVFPLEDVPTRLWPLPIERLWGVGPATARRLHAAGITRVGDIARLTPEQLKSRVGEQSGAHLHALAHGRDRRRVQPERRAKSISEERTYGTDLRDPDEIDRALLARADGVARQLRRQGWTGQTVHLKVRTGDFTTWTRSHTLREPTDLAETIVHAVRRLFRERIDLGRRGVRLLGVGVSGLERSGQAGLFVDEDERRARKMARVTDAVRNRLGDSALVRARLLRKRRTNDDDDEPEEASSLPSVD